MSDSSYPEFNGNRVLLIGWDAADWKVISPLMDRGCMPNLLKLVERGVKGNIATLHPVLSPMLWTSIATGKRPYQHGIYGFYEPTPDGMNVQPITNLSRKTKAIWNILSQCDLKTNVVGWWPSHPAEAINGVMVSDLYHKNSIRSGLPKTVPTGAIHPESMIDELAELRFDLSEVQLEDMLNFIPCATEIDQEKDKRLISCAKVFAECTTIQSAATHIMESTEWDFMAVYYDAIDHFSHMFMRFHPPRREIINEREYERFKDVVTSAYKYHDMMLGRLVELAGEDTTIVLISDHGFHPDHLRPTFIPTEPTGPAIEHRDLGIFVMAGPGIAADKLVYGTTLLDITPTILTQMGLPVGEDMDGRVISDVFQLRPDTTSVPSWDDIAGDDGSHPAGMELDPLEAKRFLQQLVDLGYIDELSPDKQENVSRAIRELNHNLASSYMDANRFADALPIVTTLYEENPDEHRFGIRLAMCYKALGHVDELQTLVELLTERRISAAIDARRKMKELNQLISGRRKQIRETNPDYDDQNKMTLEQILEDVFDEREKHEYLQARSLASVRTYYLDFLQGYALCAKGQNEQALIFLKRAIDAEPAKPSLYLQTGEACLNLNRLDEARSCFEKALSIDDSNPAAWLAMAKYSLASNRNEDAVRHALKSVAITYFSPVAHFTLGVALDRLGKHEQAVSALKNAIEQNPNFAEACELLASIHGKQFDDQRTADHYRGLATEARDFTREQQKQLGTGSVGISGSKPANFPEKETPAKELIDRWPGLRTLPNQNVAGKAAEIAVGDSIIVVTGLPRSGTSLMMQMLRGGGVRIFDDQHRPADEDNPRGYLELEQTRSLMTNNKWIDEGLGRAIKVVAPLLEVLPARHRYKVILMVRDLKEIIASQTRMLQRNGKAGADFDPEKLENALKYQFETAARLLNDKGISTLRVPYSTALAKPLAVANSVSEFLGMPLDVDQMAAQVDDSLYRNRVTNL